MGTDEKSHVAFDNAVDEPSCRRGPSRLDLKPKTWNKVRLAVAGDVVKVAVNGQEVYKRAIEPQASYSGCSTTPIEPRHASVA